MATTEQLQPTGMSLTELIPAKFTEVWFLDTEFIALDGEPNVPVALCAYELRSKRKVEMFFDKPYENPFTNPDALFICYNAVAEWKTFLALGWDIPRNCVDLYVEYGNMINGVWRGKTSLKDLGMGLGDAMREHGLDPMDAQDKETERNYIRDYGINAPVEEKTTSRTNKDGSVAYLHEDGSEFVGVPAQPCTQEEHAKRIVDYCWKDVRGTYKLALRMIGDLDLDQALWRGRYQEPASVVRAQRDPRQRRALQANRAPPRRVANRDRREGRAEKPVRRLPDRGHQEKPAPTRRIQDEEVRGTARQNGHPRHVAEDRDRATEHRRRGSLRADGEAPPVPRRPAAGAEVAQRPWAASDRTSARTATTARRCFLSEPPRDGTIPRLALSCYRVLTGSGT